jgi:DNA-binding transcriptional regulator YhcF (GntR family)
MYDSQPVFTKIMAIIENNIIDGVYKIDDIIISTTQISKLYNVNPTTANKAISRLTEDGILYKRPGIGMCVAYGAREKIIDRRKSVFFGETVDAFLKEAKVLQIPFDDLVTILEKNYKRGKT